MGLRRVSQLLLLSALLVCIRSQDQKSAFAIVGEDFTFSPKVNGMIKEIIWKKGKNKVAELEGERSPEYFGPLKGRGLLDRSSGNLTIRNVSADDAAAYEAQVLAAGSDELQITKFVLDVLDPPSLVLNCNVTNDQINILCESHFSKNVTYSWNADKGKVIKADGSGVQFEKNADLPEQVVCIVKVSKTEISSSFSLSACPQETPENLTRGRKGLTAFLIISFLLLIVIALFILWKKGLFNNLLSRIPTRRTAAYKPKEPSQEDEALQAENGQKEESHKEDENTESRLVLAVSHQNDNQSQGDEGSHQNANQSCDGEEPEYENAGVSEDAADISDEATKRVVPGSHQNGNQSQGDEGS